MTDRSAFAFRVRSVDVLKTLNCFAMAAMMQSPFGQNGMGFVVLAPRDRGKSMKCQAAVCGSTSRKSSAHVATSAMMSVVTGGKNRGSGGSPGHSIKTSPTRLHHLL